MKNLLLLMLVVITTLPCSADIKFKYTYEGQTLNYIDRYGSSDYPGTTVSVYADKDIQGDVIIPSMVEYNGREYEVTEVESFEDCTGLTSVTIPNSVTRIHQGAFSGCSGLTSVNIPDSITQIYIGTFNDCSGLTSLTIPNSITFIYSYAFSNCTNLKEVLFEGDAEEVLCIARNFRGHSWDATGAFENCPSLSKLIVGRVIEPYPIKHDYDDYVYTGIFHDTAVKEIEFTPSATAIAQESFMNIETLENITIPSTMNLIMPDAFKGCTNLKNVTFEESSEPLFMVGDFGESGIEVLNLNRQLYEGTIEVGGFGTYACKPTFAGCAGLTSINFGENFTTICDNMFSGCTALRSVTIPQFLSKIGEGAFSGCMNLKSINIEDSDTPILINSKTNSDGEGSTFAGAPLETLYLGRNVEFSGTELSPFKNKTLLTTLTIGNKTTAINNYLFYGCTNISMLSVPSSVKTIGDYAFYDCNQSRSLTISKSVESIGEYAFYNCKNLKNLTIPGSVVTIGDYAFRSCSNLTNIKIGEKVETIGNYAFLDCYSAETITLGNSVRTIGNNAFYNCQAWINITIPNSVETIGNDAFALCLGATEATIGDGVKTIGLRGFTDCENLTTLTIGKSVKEIGEMAFFNCESLKDVYVAATTPPMANESVFSDYSATLHVPEGTSSIYKSSSDTCWPLFTSVGEYVPVDTGVEEIFGNQDDNSVIEIYDLNGHCLGLSTESLAPGIYIVRQGRKTKKIML